MGGAPFVYNISFHLKKSKEILLYRKEHLMRILIIRHGDPNYVNDTLTEKGWKEAGCLAEKLAEEKLDYIYVSPLGRAKDTASVTLKTLGKEAVEYEWLR